MSENEIQAPEAAEPATKAKKQFGINFKVSAKGAVSVYGLGRFPVTLYREQWVRLLEKTGDLKQFLEEHREELKSKAEAQADAPAAEAAPAADAPAEAAPAAEAAAE